MVLFLSLFFFLFLSFQVQTLLNNYDNNFVKALLILFPKIGLDDKRFHPQIRKYKKEGKRGR